MPCHLIFFYGSLLTGPLDGGTRRALATCRPLGTAWIRGRLYDLGDYPGAVASPRGDERIWGVLHRLLDTGRSLRQLDRFEDYLRDRPDASLYLRRRTTAWLAPHGRALPCWAYFYNRPVPARQRIPDGDYRQHRSRPIDTRRRGELPQEQRARHSRSSS